jgi:type IV pilus secretin PilQ/predicted competence protein
MRRSRALLAALGACALVAGAAPAFSQRPEMAPGRVPMSEPEVVDFRVQSEGTATQIVIETTGTVRYRDEFQPLPPRLTVELLGVDPALPLREYQDIYRGGVRYVVVSAPAPDRVRLDVYLAGVSSYAVYQEGTDLYVTFDNPGDAFPLYAANPVARGGVAVVPEPGTVITRRTTVDLGMAAAPSERIDPGIPEIQGEPISVSFQNADIRTVATAFAELTGHSVVVGRVPTDILITADIRQEPWDEALVSIMRANGMDVRLEDGIIRIDSIENLRQTEELIDLQTVVIQLNFIAAEDVRGVVEPLKSERGAIQADPKTNSLVISDVPERVAQITGVIRQLDVQTPQVTIKAKIVFVNKIDLRELGVRWRSENLQDPTVDTHVLADTRGGEIADPFLELSFGTLASGLNIGGLLQALEQRELADIQAEPQTTVLNNLPAEVFVGERTPIRFLDVGADTPEARASVELIETGIILRVTPHITSTGQVLMQLQAERSGVAVADPTIGVTFNTQRATSQILVDDGETSVIGGLTVQDVSTVRTGIPVLKDIPLLGGLFRSERKRSEKRDLLIFVTPYIVPIDRPAPEIVSTICLEDQPWYEGDDPVVHNGERWLKFGPPQRQDAVDLVAVGNFHGVPIYTTVERAAVEVYLPHCAPGLYQPYRRVEAVWGTTG